MGSGREYTVPEDDMQQMMEDQQAEDYAEMECNALNALISKVAVDAVNGKPLDEIADEVKRLREEGKL